MSPCRVHMIFIIFSIQHQTMHNRKGDKTVCLLCNYRALVLLPFVVALQGSELGLFICQRLYIDRNTLFTDHTFWQYDCSCHINIIYWAVCVRASVHAWVWVCVHVYVSACVCVLARMYACVILSPKNNNALWTRRRTRSQPLQYLAAHNSQPGFNENGWVNQHI